MGSAGYRPEMMTLGDLLAEVLRFYRANFLLFTGTLGAMLGPLALAELLVPQLPVFLLLLITTLATGALIEAIGARYRREETSISQAYSAVRLGRYLTLVISTFLWIFSWSLGMVFFIIPGIYVFVRLIFFPWAIVLQHEGVFDSLRESWNLVAGSWLRVFIISGFAYLVSLIVQSIILLPFTFLHSAQLFAVAVTVGEILALPFLYSVLTMLYYDLRIRRYGDLTAFATPEKVLDRP